MRIFVGQVELLKANCRAICKISRRFRRKMSKKSKWEWKDQFRGCSSALGSSRPIRKLQHEATSSPGRACYFWTKPPARLGELGSKLLPYFGYKWAWEDEGKGFSNLVKHISLKISEEKKKEGENQGQGASVTLPWPIPWMFFVVLRLFFIARPSSTGLFFILKLWIHYMHP